MSILFYRLKEGGENMLKSILKRFHHRKTNLIKLENKAGKKVAYQLGGNYCSDLC